MPINLLQGKTTNETAPLVFIFTREPEISMMLDTLLDIWKYRTAQAKSAEELFALAEKELPSLILFDMPFSFTDGLVSVNMLQKSEAFGGAPILVLSGHVRSQDTILALSSGADDYLTKPINFERLEESLKKFSAVDDSSSQRARYGVFV